MSEPLLRILSIGFLTLLYLFFLRVLWITRSQLKAQTPRVAVAPRAMKPAQHIQQQNVLAPTLELTIADPPELRGLTYELSDKTTIGRADSAGIVLVDDFVSQFHACITLHEGSYTLEDLGSTNGTFRSGKSGSSKRIEKPTSLKMGDTFRIGAITFEMTSVAVPAEERT